MIEPVTGKMGKAWNCPMPKERPSKGQEGTLGVWILEIPAASPAWDKYCLSLVHLRPIPGVEEAKKASPDVTHEIVLAALDPKYIPNLENVFKYPGLQFLTPLNVMSQFQIDTDNQAIELLERLARACLNGILPVEPQGIIGAREMWQTLIESTALLIKKGIDSGVLDEDKLKNFHSSMLKKGLSKIELEIDIKKRY